jgi:SAM-dependent methyltransferase
MAFSRLYQTALFGPLAEQLVDAAGIAPGMRVVDVGARSGVLTRRLASAVGAGGAVNAVEVNPGAARALRKELEAARVDADVVVAPLDALPFADGEFDVAVSLLGLSGSRGGVAALGEVDRVAGAALVITRGEQPPTPEGLLARAWQEVAGFVPPGARHDAGVTPLADWGSTPLRDVVRFDSAAQLWGAMTAGPRGRAPDYVVEQVGARFRDLLAGFEGADGTLRIPVEVWLLKRE